MSYDDFNDFCRGLPASNYSLQWGGSHVWKVGAKVFAVGGWQNREKWASRLKRQTIIMKY